VAEPGGREAARRRAERIFSEAAQEGSLGNVRRDLFALASLLSREPQLRKSLSDVGIPGDVKGALLRDLLSDRVDPQALTLLESLVADDALSWRLLPLLEDLAVEAVLAETDADGTLGDVEDELFRFDRLLESQPRLRSALGDPVLPDENKRALVDELLKDRAAEATVILVHVAISRPGDPVNRIQALADRAAARRDRVLVEARTAVELDDQRRGRLAEALSHAAGRQVDLEVVVDPSVVGGVVARIGDELIDGTVRRKLELALEQLTA
jgi:F-type H+-transporting ATPase subunit delta